MNRLFFPVLTSCLTLVATAAAVPQPGAGQQQAAPEPARVMEASAARDDVIAHVGDQPITFGEINTLLNSSPIVGVSIPAVGTPERDKARIVLLDKFISADLVYLDALKQGFDKDPIYRRDVERFENALLAGLYRSHEMIGKIPVGEQEIRDDYQKNWKANGELTPDIHAAIEVKLRRQKMKERLAEASKHIRDGVAVVVHEENLAEAGDAKRPDTAVVAEVGGKPVTWGNMKEIVIAAGKGAVEVDPLAMERDARRNALESEIDFLIMARKAKAAGLDRDRMYQVRVREYRKSHLINLYRDRLIARMEPSEKELKSYYEKNKARLAQPESRKVQMVVVKTKAEAEDLKKQIASRKMTMYQAAQKYSIAAKAKQDLGEVGWVNRGDTVPALDAAIFALGSGEIGGPVETPAGWHLVTVQDVQPAKYDSFDDQATRKLTRYEMLNDKLNAYVVNLREHEFPVVVHQDVMVRLSQREADAVAQLIEKAKQPGSITQQRIQQYQKMMKR